MAYAQTRTFILGVLFLLWSPGLAQKIVWTPHRNGISDRDLLKLGDPISRLQKLGYNLRVSMSAFPDTLKILAIRVEFQEDNSPLTTGKGKFDFSAPDENPIDAPPHDLSYFQSQLLALGNYYKTVSRGKLVLTSDVYPMDPDRTYTVSKPMAEYSAATGSDDELDQKISELFNEAFQLADASDVIDFSQYDSFILFHAGVGRDFAFDFNDTPLDIPSAFLDFNTLKRGLAADDPNFQGIPVNGGSFVIRDGIILPETQNQKGFAIGLLGTAALMFGSQLGLPVLFNSENGLPGIGVFGLMDQGSGNFSGLLPAEPCAWSKIFLGWETPIIVRNAQDTTVTAPQAAGENKIYKIPIDSQEYFLLENRYRDFNDDGIAIGKTANGSRVEFKWIEDANGNISQEILIDGPGAVITEVNEYDFGLPTIPSFPASGSGILIWHIDERVIRANLSSNRVNADPEHRGVDLEEADGAQDIGQVYGFLSAGSGSENGVIEDMFWGSNEINMLVNASNSVEFTPFTTPGSIANSGVNTQIYIDNFSEPGIEMTFSVRDSIGFEGFPQFLGIGESRNSPVIADLNNDGFQEVISTASTSPEVFVLNMDGTKFIANTDSAEIENLGRTSQSVPLARFSVPPGTSAFSPAIAAANLQSAVIVVTDLAVASYLPEDISPQDGRADSLFVYESPVELTTAPLIEDSATNLIGFRIVVGTKPGDLLIVESNGTARFLSNQATGEVSGLALLAASNKIVFVSKSGEVGLTNFDGNLEWKNNNQGTLSTAPVIGDLNQDGELNIIALTDDGQIYQFELDGTNSPGFPKSTNAEISSEIAIGDIDNDGYMEIVFVAAGNLYAFNHIGSLENNFPIRISPDEVVSDYSSPVLADLDADGAHEIIVGSTDNQLVAFHFTGQAVSGFPLSTGDAVRSTPFLADIENDGDLDIAVVSNDGYLYLWDLPFSFEQNGIAWNGLYHDAHHSNANLMQLQPVPATNGLMPKNSVYNYPNPTKGNSTTIRYRLNFPAEVKIKIYDLAGHLVDELPGTGFEQAENEVVWALDKIQSGVYLAAVQAEGNSSRNTAIIKIAVVK